MTKLTACVFGFTLALCWSVAAHAIDHNNIDEGRPLRFEDASSVAWHERAIEVGFGAGFPRRGSAQLNSKLEFLYGAFLNTHFGVALEPNYDSGADQLDANNLELSFFHALRREIGNGPALAYRIGIGLPTARDAKGVEGQVRAILTKALRQYDKVHLNLDAQVNSDPTAGARDAVLGAVFGYTMPLGYPRSFTQTMLAEFAVEQSSIQGQGWIGTLGLGLRKQVGVRSVIDAGVESDVFITDGASRVPFRFSAGYSVGF